MPVETDENFGYEEAERVARWRYNEFRRLGFAKPDAHLLAEKEHVDIHALEDLVVAGCPTDVAARILT